jgi:hypothetical protein
MKHLTTPNIDKTIKSLQNMVDNYGKESNIGKAYLKNIEEINNNALILK